MLDRTQSERTTEALGRKDGKEGGENDTAVSSRFYGSGFQGHGPSVSEAFEYSFEDCSFGGHTHTSPNGISEAGAREDVF